jgi:plastocyanin
MHALIGQRTASDLNLVAQLLILAGLWVGFGFARRKQIPRHQAMQTTMVLVNSFFILFVMGTSFYSYVIAGGTTTGTVATLMIIHGVIGLLAELTGIYLILRMSTKILPAGLRVRNFRLVMRSLLGLWTALVLLGVGIYYARYLAPKPAVAVSPLVLLVHGVDDLQIHAAEMSEAVSRGNLATAKRHAEHLVNLIVGKGSADYGDVDGDGVVEDPGDGTGAVVYLERVRASAGQNAGSAAGILDQMQAAMVRLAGDAKAVVRAQDAGGVTQQIEEAMGLVGQLHDGPNALINQLGQALGEPVVRPTAVVGAAPSGAGTVTVVMQNFAFSPARLQVKAGTSIVFVNRDAAKHTVTSDTGRFKSGDIGAGQSYTLKLDAPGSYPYYCEFHGDKGGVDMAATIEVTP